MWLVKSVPLDCQLHTVVGSSVPRHEMIVLVIITKFPIISCAHCCLYEITLAHTH